MKILVTGGLGFIGSNFIKNILEKFPEFKIYNLDDELIGSNHDNLKEFQNKKNYSFVKEDMQNFEKIVNISSDVDVIVNFAAETHVDRSIVKPYNFINNNIIGTFNILEGCRHNNVEHLVYASSSSVYGLSTKYPFSVEDNVSHPVSFYGATKIANELMAHSYSHLYRIPTTGLRFFTVYGPWGRPDMAYFLFTQSILASKPIDIYNHGNMERDFTYIDDIVEGVIKVTNKIPKADPGWNSNTPNPASSSAPYRLYNIGSNTPVRLMDYISEIEKNLKVKAKINMMPMQDGDINKSHADIESLTQEFGYTPKYSIQSGIKNFIKWYMDYYHPS